MRQFTTLLVFAVLIQSIVATVPLVLYSHKLVPKVQSYVSHHNKYVLSSERVTEVLRNLISPCSSNAYILVSQPGLTLDDLQHHEGYTFLRTHSFMASTLGVIPRAEEPVDFEELKKLVVRKCDATVVELNGLSEVETYIDTRTRVIMIELPELPSDPKERVEALAAADEAMKRTIRKLPSPHHTLIYTTLDKRLLDKYDEKRWKTMSIFADIIKQDATRDYEYERNDRVRNVERPFPEKRTNYLDRELLKVPSFIDKELILENELLVICVLLLTAGLILLQVVQILIWISKKLVRFVKGEKKCGSKEDKKNK